MKIINRADLKPGDMITVFYASRLYGGPYLGEHLPQQHWEWPRETWLERRREQMRKEQNEQANR